VQRSREIYAADLSPEYSGRFSRDDGEEESFTTNIASATFAPFLYVIAVKNE
jgi:hypothetical protein